MTHKHCDRCGAIIKEPTFKHCFVWEPHYARLSFFKANKVDYSYTYDFCGKCMKELQDWIEEGDYGDKKLW